MRKSSTWLADRALSALDVDSNRGSTPSITAISPASPSISAAGPVGIDTIAASLSESRDALEDIVEPYLLQLGLPQPHAARKAADTHAFRHLGLAVPQRPAITQGVLPLDES
jgi:holliday junction DNA helicase RuvB